MERLGAQVILEGKIRRVFRSQYQSSRYVLKMLTQGAFKDSRIFFDVHVKESLAGNSIFEEGTCVQVGGVLDMYNNGRLVVYADWVTQIVCRKSEDRFVSPYIIGEGNITGVDFGDERKRYKMKLNLLMPSFKAGWFLNLYIMKMWETANKVRARVRGKFRKGQCVRFGGVPYWSGKTFSVIADFVEVVECGHVVKRYDRKIDADNILKVTEKFDKIIAEEAQERKEAEEAVAGDLKIDVDYEEHRDRKSEVKIVEDDEDLIIELD